MQEYEQTGTVAAPANEVFAWLSDVENLPRYLPPIKEAGIDGAAEAGKPGEKVRMRGEIPDRGEFESEGYLDVDAEARTMRWGAETGRDYSGDLEVAEAGDGESRVTVRLSFGPRTVEPEIQEQSPTDRDPLEESLAATLESIRRQIEEGSGKVPPPSPGD